MSLVYIVEGFLSFNNNNISHIRFNIICYKYNNWYLLNADYMVGYVVIYYI